MQLPIVRVEVDFLHIGLHVATLQAREFLIG